METQTTIEHLNVLAALVVHRRAPLASIAITENQRCIVIGTRTAEEARAVVRGLMHPAVDADFSITAEPYRCRRTGHTHRVILALSND